MIKSNERFQSCSTDRHKVDRICGGIILAYQSASKPCEKGYVGCTFTEPKYTRKCGLDVKWVTVNAGNLATPKDLNNASETKAKYWNKALGSMPHSQYEYDDAFK